MTRRRQYVVALVGGIVLGTIIGQAVVVVFGL